MDDAGMASVASHDCGGATEKDCHGVGTCVTALVGHPRGHLGERVTNGLEITLARAKFKVLTDRAGSSLVDVFLGEMR